MASRFDDELWELVPAEPGPPPPHLVEFVRGLGPAGRVLDLGCGDGRLSAELDAAELTAADVSRVALDRAARAAARGARWSSSSPTRRCRSPTAPSTWCWPRRPSSTCATCSCSCPRSGGCSSPAGSWR